MFEFGITAMTVALILLCLLLNYFFLTFLSLISIVLFDCFVILLHYFLGPKVIFEYIYILSWYLSGFLLFIYRHPYLFCFLVLCMSFGYPLFSFYRFMARRNEKKVVRTLVDQMIDLNRAMEDIKKQLRSMESKIDTVLESTMSNSYI